MNADDMYCNVDRNLYDSAINIIKVITVSMKFYVRSLIVHFHTLYSHHHAFMFVQRLARLNWNHQ